MQLAVEYTGLTCWPDSTPIYIQQFFTLSFDALSLSNLQINWNLWENNNPQRKGRKYFLCKFSSCFQVFPMECVIKRLLLLKGSMFSVSSNFTLFFSFFFQDVLWSNFAEVIILMTANLLTVSLDSHIFISVATIAVCLWVLHIWRKMYRGS